MATEKHSIDKWARCLTQEAGGLYIKLPALYYPGIPDCALFLPGGRVVICEDKTSKGRLFRKQQEYQETFKKLGFEVYVPRSKSDIADIIYGGEK